MTEERLKKLYFTWMCRLVKNDSYPNRSLLLKRLHNTDFSYMTEMDGNRMTELTFVIDLEERSTVMRLRLQHIWTIVRAVSSK